MTATVPKLLFVGFNARYINPTNAQLPAIFKLAGDATFYGPGFVDAATLARGLERFHAERGPFDAIVTTTQLCTEGDIGAIQRFYARYSLHAWAPDLCAAFVPDARRFLAGLRAVKICFLTDLDVYAVGAAAFEQLRTRATHFVSWARGFSRPMDRLAHLQREAFYHRKKESHEFGLWDRFVADHYPAFINLSHCVGEHEFDWTPLAERPYQAFVPGQLYARRQDALQQLARAGDLRLPSWWYRKAFSALDRLGLRPYAHLHLHHLYHLTFVDKIRNTRCAITDGSGYERPIRKYFEIPALGSVLVCWPCAGFDDLGFRDGVNAIAIDEVRVAEQVRALSADPARAQAIADAGRALVWNRHSVHARAEQFGRCLRAIRTGRYAGSHWRDGEFVVEETAECAA